MTWVDTLHLCCGCGEVRVVRYQAHFHCLSWIPEVINWEINLLQHTLLKAKLA